MHARTKIENELKNLYPNFVISDRIKAHQSIWVLGDRFVKNSANTYFKTVDDKSSYSTRHFQISILDSDDYTSNIKSVLARLRNNLVYGLNKCNAIPKFIVVVLEDAIIDDVGSANYGITNDYEIRTKWLINQYRKIVDAFLDYLPYKSKKDGWPKFLYISPSMHRNYRNNALRKKFTRVLEDICSITERMALIRIRAGWDFDDNNIFLDQQQRYTTEGLASFWNAVDKVIEEFDQFIFSTVDAPLDTSKKEFDRSRNNNNNNSRPEFNNRNDFSWQSPTYQARRNRGGKAWRGGRF